MAKKNRTVFVCQECGYESPKWMGQCICGAWNTMVEEKITDDDSVDRRRRSSAAGQTGVRAEKLSEVTASDAGERISSGIGELDRVLGGGLVKGSLILISGEPGIGKSTLIMQAAASIAEEAGSVLYMTGEESQEQIKLRADRVCGRLSDDLYIMADTSMENMISEAEKMKPALIIIDSIQTMYTSELESSPGSVSQVRACCNELMRVGKVMDIPVFIVAHVTKSGELAGPRTIEHLVDCVLSFTGERSRELRILRSLKNRFGTTSEIGAFEMAEEGLVEISDLSGRFLEEMDKEAEGSVVTAVYEGTRPLLLEVQALTASSNMSFPRRTAIGAEASRLNMILAVLERKAGIPVSDYDVYVNIVGGLRPEGTSIDLAVALAVCSSYSGRPCRADTLVLGEIGLTGDLRSVQNTEKIIREAARMGFAKIVLPEKQARKLSDICAETGIQIEGARNITEAVRICIPR